MQIRVTVDVFSGRPNPSFILNGPEAEDLAARLQPETLVEDIEQFRRVESRLGYRGIVVEPLQDPARWLRGTVRVAGGLVLGAETGYQPADAFTEDFVCGSAGPLRKIRPRPELDDFLRREIEDTREWVHKKPRKPRPWPSRMMCRCAPLYEPDWWNDGWGGQRQPNNNCYNYATNYRSDTFAQPGYAGGQQYASITCAEELAGAVRDDLIDNPGADNKCPDEGHLVGLVVGPGWDFHWYRKGRNGYWSHKPGGTEVTNIDNSGALISDPRTADRGSYTDFCTFMTVMHGHIKVQ